MSEDINKIIEESKGWNADNGEYFWIFLILMLAFGGLGSSENSKISELEKKVARLEGQMSMIGGKFHE